MLYGKNGIMYITLQYNIPQAQNWDEHEEGRKLLICCWFEQTIKLHQM